MAVISDLTTAKSFDRIDLKCDSCFIVFTVELRAWKQKQKHQTRRGQGLIDLCPSCQVKAIHASRTLSEKKAIADKVHVNKKRRRETDVGICHCCGKEVKAIAIKFPSNSTTVFQVHRTCRKPECISYLKGLTGKSEANRARARIAWTGANNPRYGKPPLHGRYTLALGIKFRSRWEAAYALYLYDNEIKFTYEPIAFPLSNGKSYIPDFELEDKTIVEVKGFWRDDSKQKWEEFLQLYPLVNTRVVSMPELNDIGILKGKKITSKYLERLTVL